MEIILLMLGVIMLLAGIIYAWWTVVRPSHPSETWAWVAVGVGGTLIGIALAQWLLTRDWLNVAIPAIYFGATGIPMIVGQFAKSRRQRQEEERFQNRLKSLD